MHRRSQEILISHKYDFGCQSSDSCLLTLVSIDILAILGPLYTGLIYNNMAGSIVHILPQIDFSLISLDSLPPDDYIRSATALLILMTWVGFYYQHAHMHVCACMRVCVYACAYECVYVCQCLHRKLLKPRFALILSVLAGYSLCKAQLRKALSVERGRQRLCHTRSWILNF